MNTNAKGFTLIELLVVIAIIGLLSAVVLASLGTARNKGRDASIMQEVNQIANSMELEYLNSGNYANLFVAGGWAYTAANCNANFAGTHAAKVREICTNIVNNISGGQGVYINIPSGSNSAHFTIMAYLPGSNKAYCVSDRGQKSSSCAWGTWSCSGCYANP